MRWRRRGRRRLDDEDGVVVVVVVGVPFPSRRNEESAELRSRSENRRILNDESKFDDNILGGSLEPNVARQSSE